MGAYFAYDYTGEPFRQLGLPHISAVLLVAGLVLASWRVSLTPKTSRWVRYFLASILAVNEIFWHAWHIYYGLWTVRDLLPLEICNLMVIASVWALLTRNQVVYEFVYLLGITAGSQILITPALGRYGFPHVLFFQIFISHGGMVLAALYLTLNEGMRVRSWRSVRRVAVWTTIYAGVIFLLNLLLGSNYLFLAHKPPAVTLLDYLGPWPWYILSMEAIGLAAVSLLYLPFHFRKAS